MGAKLTKAVRHVDDAGDQGEEARGCDDVDERYEHDLQHDPGNRRHLEKGGDFASPGRTHRDLAVEKMQDGAADQDHSVAADHEHRKPEWKLSILRIDIAPVADAQGNDAAEEKALVSNRVEDDAERAFLVVTAGDVTIEPVTRSRDEEDDDRRVALPLNRLPRLDALPIIDRHQDEGRDHQDADKRDLVGSGHVGPSNMLTPSRKNKGGTSPAGGIRRATGIPGVHADRDTLCTRSSGWKDDRRGLRVSEAGTGGRPFLRR